MSTIKNQQEILAKLEIVELNEMQKSAQTAIALHSETIIVSPTGTGKTLAFLLPIIELLNPELDKIQALIIAPSRELAIQIEQVIRDMGSGLKANAVYGGRSGSKDLLELSHAPAILVGTPGRLADHFRRERVDTAEIKILVLDEFDKSLEVGFEKELREIMEVLTGLEKKILTSATQKTAIPEFLKMKDPQYLHFTGSDKSQLAVKRIDTTNKLKSLENLLHYLGTANGIIFCNFKESIQEVSDYLADHEIRHVTFHGSLEQVERENALIKFRNGTQRILLATDLAARGIDVPALDYIIHFELPVKEDEFIHRNGRTARMQSNGTAFVIKSTTESIPDFIDDAEILDLPFAEAPPDTLWETLFISGGRKDKISKGDIAGLFFKQGNLEKGELGEIELKQDCAFVAVPFEKADTLVKQLNNSRLKKKKVRIRILD